MLNAVSGPGGRRIKFGRRPPRPHTLKLSLRNYLLKSFPQPPPTIDYTTKALAFLADPLGNDSSGDCTVAGAYHLIDVFLTNNDVPVPFVAADVEALYCQLSGWNGIEDDPSDTGLECQQMLNYWLHNGLPPEGDHIAGWVAIRPSSVIECQAALWLFENLYFGVGLPKEWVYAMDDMKDGFVWDVAGPPDPDHGHCFIGAGYTKDGVIIGSTWGLKGLITWPAVAKYCGGISGELYAVLDPAIIDDNTKMSAAGLNWTQLASDFQSVGA